MPRLQKLDGCASRLRRFGIVCLLLSGLAAAVAHARPAEDDLAQLMRAGGQVLLLRHAYAPGTGDPAEFRIDDCSTQRNLSAAGRKQAKAIGAWLRARDVERARVYTSQWCRCRETAELLDLGPVSELPALNSFYQRPQDREPNLAALRSFLARQPLDGELLILVTHQVTITAVSGEYAPSGHAVLMALGQGGALRTTAQIDFGQ